MMKNIQLNIRLKDGNSQAYKELFKQTFPRMLVYCRLFVHDQAQSNNLVQECFIKLWEKHIIIKPFKLVESLLFVMLRNKCLNYIRDQKIHNIEKDPDSLVEDELQYLYQLDFTGHEEASLKEKIFFYLSYVHHTSLRNDLAHKDNFYSLFSNTFSKVN